MPGQEDFISGQEGLWGTVNFITCKLKPERQKETNYIEIQKENIPGKGHRKVLSGSEVKE